MPRTRWLVPILILFCGLLAGCGAPPVTVAPAARVATPPPPAAPGSVAITGDVRTPTVLTPQALAKLPQKSVPVVYRTGTGTEAHIFSGVLVSDVLPVSALATPPGKNTFLQFAVLGKATDDYSALVSYGELSPDFGNRKILVATKQDGKPLPRPRLVVPGDVKGGRYVSDLYELKVVRVAP